MRLNRTERRYALYSVLLTAIYAVSHNIGLTIALGVLFAHLEPYERP